MRAVKTYSFKIGTKIPFPEWPSIVNTFLKEQNLNYDSFRYIFEAFAGNQMYRAFQLLPVTRGESTICRTE